MSNESTVKTVVVATVLSVVCSIALAAAVTLLKPIQAENRELEKQRKILSAASILEEGKGNKEEVNKLFAGLERYLVTIDSGEFRKVELDDRFDQRKAARDPARSIKLTGEQDIANIKRRANEADIYVVRNADGKLEKLILPISGYGLWSTMYGYLVVNNDGNTIGGITFTEQGETPGLGGEVDNPKWKALWPGKTIYDAGQKSAIHLVKGSVDLSRPEATHQVDGLSGATLTSNGVTHLVQFWTGELGFQKFLGKVREGGI
ncbi:MAG: Na(+)-translocating NADH-quinone reductase subunit C [Moraxellaceae bacterium]|jgi:Na+-transporting NADH:ubiquinone oxidoreductase subunit C|nr:Na(+)-translocating NADH-quinone reductase subunit C [Moraxellaceae bacterium]MBP9045462.1 Na(+)-translocating NADH-quinone reductase subunit C [Moraxellaceae bacterium]MBP9731329.1 Na(+)-translocating NADH-quinone reductase subunit C [Moraxellaceae bacterium]